MAKNNILVTGGAGYIGSHVVRQLGAAGEDVITLDNLSTGFEAAVTAGDLVIGDTGDAVLLDRIFADHSIDTVMHFAAHTIVPESVADPLKYYGNNTASSRTLLERAHAHGVKHVVFSSTAAVYGIPDGGKASEDSATQPINPYGSSKLMTEWMLRDLAMAGGPSYVSLRYFNVAGCEPGGTIGQSTPGATLLACVTAVDRNRTSPFAPHMYARRVSGRPFLMLMGRQDKGIATEPEAEYLLDQIDSQTKRLIFFDSGHRLPPTYVPEAVAWFREHL